MIGDTGAAWIARADDDKIIEPYLYDMNERENYAWPGETELTTVMQALEKARREALLFETLPGARTNFIRHVALKDRRGSPRSKKATNDWYKVEERKT